MVQRGDDVDMVEFVADDNAPETTPEKDEALLDACDEINNKNAATLFGKEAILKRWDEDGSETMTNI